MCLDGATVSGDLPFGFAPRDPDDEGDDQAGPSRQEGPFGFGGGDPAQFDPSQFDLSQIGAMLSQVGQMLQSGGQQDGPVNWTLAQNTARTIVAQAGDPSVSGQDRRDVERALDLAALWLDPVMSFPATTSGGGAWSRSEWIEATLPSLAAGADAYRSKPVDIVALRTLVEDLLRAGR